MSTIRVNKTKDYTIMSNCHFREKDMSLKAKGLLSLMLSLPDNWDYSISGLVAICKENESAIKSTLDELKDFGYLVVNKKMPNETDSGRIEYEYVIYESKQDGVKQDLENLGVEFQGVENQGQYNIYQLNTEKENTNNKKETYKESISLAIDYLNEKTGARYRKDTSQTVRLLKSILKSFTLDDIKNVIDKKCEEWKGTEYETYLRPMTLFGSKFENYLNSKVRRRSQVGKHIEESLEGYDHLFG